MEGYSSAKDRQALIFVPTDEMDKSKTTFNLFFFSTSGAGTDNITSLFPHCKERKDGTKKKKKKKETRVFFS